MWLGIDSGNTRVKWALFERRRMVRHAVCAGGRLNFPAADTVDATLVAHVGGAARQARLRRALAGRRAVRFLRAGAAAAGVKNRYSPPAALGVDRWLCLLAARRRAGAACVVVSAGTAVTIDILQDNGDFAGGFILPGLRLMPAALARATPLTAPAQPVPALGMPDFSAPPRNTTKGMTGGAALAAAGAALVARRHFAPRAPLYVTGGDAPCLMPLLPAARHAPYLLFEGMALLHRGARHD